MQVRLHFTWLETPRSSFSMFLERRSGDCICTGKRCETLHVIMTFCENLLMMTTYVLVLSPQSFSSSIAAFRPCRDLGFFQKVLLHRLRRARPLARVTYTEGPEARKTSITLQDGCFGAGALMRIAAMFARPNQPEAVTEESGLELQATPVTAAADTVAMPQTPPPSAPESAQSHRYVWTPCLST